MSQFRDLSYWGLGAALALGSVAALLPRVEMPGPLPLNAFAEWPITVSFLAFAGVCIAGSKLSARLAAWSISIGGGLLAFAAAALAAVGVGAV